MTIKELIKNLQAIKKEYGDIEVISANDDEGNGFQDIFSAPTPVERLTKEAYMTSEDLEWDNPKVNCVIIN